MPGSKRKSEERPWISSPQRKKLKNQGDPSVYYNTLQKLRLGAIKSFANQDQQRPIQEEAEEDVEIFEIDKQKCEYCEQSHCELRPCMTCNNEYCKNCSIQRYDNTNTDKYMCFGCLSLKP